MTNCDVQLQCIEKAVQGAALSQDDMICLLSIEDEALLSRLFEAARAVRSFFFQNKIFTYGFVYFSTYCRNNCHFCNFRQGNAIKRYRKTPEEIIDICIHLADSGVHLIDLTTGEDEVYHKERFTSILNTIKTIKQETGIPVMISPGVIDNDAIERFAHAGADWYALYQETHNETLFAKLRAGQSYKTRMDAKLFAQSRGMLIEEGILVGVGETLADIADSLLTMKRIGARQWRVMSFIPHNGTPMANVQTPERSLELKVIAVMRLLCRDALIPASLDVDGMDGLSMRLNAGANVITSIIPPKSGLSGVAQTGEGLADSGRTVAEACGILHRLGLEAATLDEYKQLIQRLKANVCVLE